MFDFSGMQLTMTKEVCVLSSEHALNPLSSVVIGGGFQQTRFILNRHVPHNYQSEHPVREFLQHVETMLASCEPSRMLW